MSLSIQRIFLLSLQSFLCFHLSCNYLHVNGQREIKHTSLDARHKTADPTIINNRRRSFGRGEITLDPRFVISDRPQKRRFDFTLTNQTAAFDGYTRSVLLINGQFPGPLIEVNEGDEIEVIVRNKISSPVSIHWHGLFQEGTPWMDGPSGITQCPIRAHSSFVYRFRAARQFGTFWYHAHYVNLKSDGLMGPLIIHSPRDPLVRGRDFDQESILFLNDWYHDMSLIITSQMATPEGYRGSQIPPSPNSALINGIGFFDCERFAPNSGRLNPCRTNRSPLEINVFANQRTRFRIIQGSSRMQMRVSIDEHLFSVIEADSIPVRKTIPIHRLPIHGGERYSILMDTNNNKPGDSFYLRSIMVTDCINNAAPELNTTSGQTALAVLRVVSPDSTVKMSSDLSLPTTQDWNEAITGPCIDLDRNLLSPIKPTPLVGPVAGRVFFNTSLGTIIVPGSRNVTRNVVSKFFMNNITWIPSYERPILHDFLEGGNPDHINRSEIALGIMDHDGPWELIINNLDAALEHPIHLHGVDSCIVGSGAGVLTSSNAEQAKRNLNNPLCRDSFVVQGGGYLILRIQVLNPGAWFIHCHLGWHLASGFAGVVVMRPDAIRQFQLPPAHRQLCKDFINRDSFPSLDGSSYNSQAGSNGSEGISDNYHGSDHVQKTSSKVCRPTSKMYQR